MVVLHSALIVQIMIDFKKRFMTHSYPNIICHKWHIKNASMRIQKRGLFYIPNLQLVSQSNLSRKLMILLDFVLITVGLNGFVIKNLYILFLIFGLLNKLNHAKVYTKLKYVVLIIQCMFKKVMIGKQHAKHDMGILNML